jgi:hypothetical protein
LATVRKEDTGFAVLAGRGITRQAGQACERDENDPQEKDVRPAGHGFEF